MDIFNECVGVFEAGIWLLSVVIYTWAITVEYGIV